MFSVLSIFAELNALNCESLGGVEEAFRLHRLTNKGSFLKYCQNTTLQLKCFMHVERFKAFASEPVAE